MLVRGQVTEERSGEARRWRGVSDMNGPSFSVNHLKVACSNCNLRELCLPLGLSLQDIEKL
jgi:hypothetical protein